MEEIKVRNNPLGIQVFVTNRTSIATLPKEQFELFVSSLTDLVIEYYSKNKDK